MLVSCLCEVRCRTRIGALLNHFVCVDQGAGNLSLYDRCIAHQFLCKICPGCLVSRKLSKALACCDASHLLQGQRQFRQLCDLQCFWLLFVCCLPAVSSPFLLTQAQSMASVAMQWRDAYYGSSRLAQSEWLQKPRLWTH